MDAKVSKTADERFLQAHTERALFEETSGRHTTVQARLDHALQYIGAWIRLDKDTAGYIYRHSVSSEK